MPDVSLCPERYRLEIGAALKSRRHLFSPDVAAYVLRLGSAVSPEEVARTAFADPAAMSKLDKGSWAEFVKRGNVYEASTLSLPHTPPACMRERGHL